MAKLDDVGNGGIRYLTGNTNETKNTLAINAAAALTIKTTGTASYTVNGVFYTKAALSAQVLTPAAGTSFPASGVPVGKTAYLVIALDAAGSVFTVHGEYDGQTFPGATRVGKTLIPDVASTLTPIGIIKVTSVSAIWYAAVSALDLAGVTFTFYDVRTLPAGNL